MSISTLLALELCGTKLYLVSFPSGGWVGTEYHASQRCFSFAC